MPAPELDEILTYEVVDTACGAADDCLWRSEPGAEQPWGAVAYTLRAGFRAAGVPELVAELARLRAMVAEMRVKLAQQTCAELLATRRTAFDEHEKTHIVLRLAEERATIAQREAAAWAERCAALEAALASGVPAYATHQGPTETQRRAFADMVALTEELNLYDANPGKVDADGAPSASEAGP